MKKTTHVIKKTAIAATVALAGLAVSAQAAPKENTWYAGAKAGWSHFYGGGLYDGNENFLPNDGPTHKDPEGAGAFVGYQTSPYLGFELGYDWLGRVARKGDLQSGAFKAQGVQVAAKVDYPLSPVVDIYTRLGGMAWRVDAVHSNHVAGTRYSDHDTGISPLAAAGLEFAMSKNVATRLDYQFVNNVGDKHTVGSRPDHTMVSLGVSYRFNQDEKPMPMPIAAPAPEVQTQRFMLKSDVLFDFNKAMLKESGRQELDNLYTQLRNMGKNSGAVVVIGHTDRIGSQRYNLQLSERRAQSVVDYLISKGIPAGSISARGMGKAESITGNECHGIKNKASLIRCLAPDRRVVVEVAGVKEIVVN